MAPVKKSATKHLRRKQLMKKINTSSSKLTARKILLKMKEVKTPDSAAVISNMKYGQCKNDVVKIIDVRMRGTRHEIQVKLLGRKKTDGVWYPVTMFPECSELVKEFLEENKKNLKYMMLTKRTSKLKLDVNRLQYPSNHPTMLADPPMSVLPRTRGLRSMNYSELSDDDFDRIIDEDEFSDDDEFTPLFLPDEPQPTSFPIPLPPEPLPATFPLLLPLEEEKTEEPNQIVEGECLASGKSYYKSVNTLELDDPELIHIRCAWEDTIEPITNLDPVSLEKMLIVRDREIAKRSAAEKNLHSISTCTSPQGILSSTSFQTKEDSNNSRQTLGPTNAFRPQTLFGSNSSLQSPVGFSTYIQNPFGSYAASQTPVGSNTSSKTPIGSNVSSETPIASNASSQNPIGLNPSPHTPGVVLNTCTESPIGSNTCTESPIGLNTSFQAPIGSNAYIQPQIGSNTFLQTRIGSLPSFLSSIGSNGPFQTPTGLTAPVQTPVGLSASPHPQMGTTEASHAGNNLHRSNSTEVTHIVNLNFMFLESMVVNSGQNVYNPNSFQCRRCHHNFQNKKRLTRHIKFIRQNKKCWF